MESKGDMLLEYKNIFQATLSKSDPTIYVLLIRLMLDVDGIKRMSWGYTNNKHILRIIHGIWIIMDKVTYSSGV